MASSKFKMGLIGPAENVIRAAALFSGENYPVRTTLDLKAVAVTDMESGSLPKLSVPVFSDWRRMVSENSLEVVLNLSDDPGLKAELRRDLPVDVELNELFPSRSLYTSFLARQGVTAQSRARQKFLDEVVDSLPIATIVYDAQGRIRHWNRACEGLTGVAAKDVIGTKDVGAALYTLERPLLGQLILDKNFNRQLLDKYFDESLEIEPLPDGFKVTGYYTGLKSELKGRYHVQARKVIMGDRPIGSLEIIQDLSPIYKLRTQFQKQQQQLRAIISHLPFPLLQTTMDGKVIFANHDAHEVFIDQLSGGSPVRGSSLFELIPELGKKFESFTRGRSLERSAASFETHSRTFKILWREMDWEVTFLMLPDEKESWTLMWILYNLTGKEEKSRINAALAVAGAISHELSQPLTAIVNSAQLLVGTPPDNVERLDRHKNIIIRESERVFDLHRKLQNISKYKLKDYLDTHIFDLDESSELSLTIPENPEEEDIHAPEPDPEDS